MILILGVGLIPGPEILGVWESYHFFHTFGALQAPLEFFISPRAGGDPGIAMIEISRNIINFFGLRLALETFRIPAILYGGISLILFFIIARRYFGKWAALAATSMLAVNPMFHQFQHTMTIVMPSGMAFLFFIERLQSLEYRYSSFIAWSGLVVATALVALHYVPGRIFGFILLGLWFTKAYIIMVRKTGGSLVLDATLKKAFFALLMFLVLMTLLDWRNLPALVRFYTFLLLYAGEVAIFSPQYDPYTPSFLTMVFFNWKILFESLFTNGGDYHSAFATYQIADYRFPLLHPALLPFVLSGLIICFARLKQRTLLLAVPWLSVCTLFFICTLPVFFSLVFYNYPSLPNGSGTLSNHRLFYMLFPLYLFVAVFVHWVLADNKRRRFTAAPLAVVVVLIFVWSVYGLAKENSRFEAQIATINPSLSGPLAHRQWHDGTANLDRSHELASHLQQHAQYFHAAKEIMQLVRKNNAIDQSSLIQVNINRFTESPITPTTLAYIKELNFHAPFLALYLADEGLDLAWVQMLNKNRTTKKLGFSRPREFSAPMVLDEDAGLGYQNPQELVGMVQYFGLSAKPAAILATTPEETEVARRWFDAHDLSYRTISIPSKYGMNLRQKKMLALN